MRTKIRAQRPSTETKPNKEVEPDTDTDSEDSIDVKRDGVISAQEARAATATTETAGAAEPKPSRARRPRGSSSSSWPYATTPSAPCVLVPLTVLSLLARQGSYRASLVGWLLSCSNKL